MKKLSTRTAAEPKSANEPTIAIKLTDDQRIVLSSAAQRDYGAASLPERITEKAIAKIAATLITKGLVREARARAHMLVWRRNESGRKLALIITKLGREAIRGGHDHQKDDASKAASAPSIASAALSQIATTPQSKLTIPRHGSKLAEVMALLGRKQGVGIKELTSVTGWLPHTARAALTGLRKRGVAIERSLSEEGDSVYRIVAGAAPALAA